MLLRTKSLSALHTKVLSDTSQRRPTQWGSKRGMTSTDPGTTHTSASWVQHVQSKVIACGLKKHDEGNVCII